MKKGLIIFCTVAFLSACNNDRHTSGAVEDTKKDADTSALLPSAKGEPNSPGIDTSKMKGKDREDIQQRDTNTHK